MADYMFMRRGENCLFTALVCPQCDDGVDEVWCVDGVLMCFGCRNDYRKDHPDMEEEVARAEWVEDR